MSRYWANNPELLDEITIQNLPESWFSRVSSDEITLQDVPDDVLTKAMLEGEAEHWASKADAAKETLGDK